MQDREHGEARRAPDGVSRRTFLATVGVGAVGAAAGRAWADASDERAPVLPAGELTKIALQVNGRRHEVLVEPRWSLLYVLRERLGLTGAKESCGRGECGACTVLVDGRPRYACLTLAVEARDHAIETAEGLLEGEALGPVQQAFLEEDAFQCGYCTPGQVVAVEGLLRAAPEPTPEEIRRGVSGNLCRCGTYEHIFRAAARAATLRREKGGR